MTTEAQRQYRREYMREWRKKNPLTGIARAKANARNYANVYKSRGKLTPKPCRCGSTNVEMHHPDYKRPLEVVWMCRECHMAEHRRLATTGHM